MKRAAIIGCGALGTILVTNFARAEGWTLTGVMARTKAHAEALAAKEESIAQTLLEVQGEPADLGGYFLPDEEKANAVMRPSAEFNEIIDGLRK